MGEVSYKDFRDRIRKRIWPAGEPRNLRDPHTEMIRRAMVVVGQWLDRLQINHTSVFPACSTYVQCAKTIVPMPNGFIRRVFTIANDEWCDPVYYWLEPYPVLECRARNLTRDWAAPANHNMPALQQGIRFAEASTDSSAGRAQIGQWALWRNRLYIYPWLQSNERLVVEWDGWKQHWQDDDVLDDEFWTTDVEEAIETHVRWNHEKNYGDPARAKFFKDEFNNPNDGGLLGNLMYWDRRKVEQRDWIQPCPTRRLPTSAEIADDVAPTPSPDSQFAIIGDFGNPNNGTAEKDVAAMVKTWNDGEKFFIVTTGDNIYAPENDYARAVGAFYSEFLTEDLTTNRFWPALGNHDYTDPVGGLADFQGYFTLPNNERYYDFVKGATHFFVLNSSLQSLGGTPPDPDGLTSTSRQAEWLRVKLKLSTAKWKVVIVQDPPYTLGTDYPGHSILRWPFQSWGADVVISGDTHAYERYEVDGFPYVVCGCSGTVLTNSFNPDNAGTLVNLLKAKTNSGYGAIKGTATCEELRLDFYLLPGVLFDSLVLTKTKQKDFAKSTHAVVHTGEEAAYFVDPETGGIFVDPETGGQFRDPEQ